ncbi:hypothetical protein ABXT08_17555 [Chryseobacterium sp. NRRL B-14859]|uniref:hypothetical protein n=1 Tax=unclassified Chryseobacterium TaxID=2593645 RepID=UPI00333E5390
MKSIHKILLGLLPLVFVGCKKEAPAKEEEKVKVSDKGCFSPYFMEKILDLQEMKSQAKFLDSLTKGKGSIGFLVDSSKVHNVWNYSISAGYNGPDRFETYHLFHASSDQCDILKIQEPVSGEYISIEEWRKRKTHPTATESFLKPGNYDLPLKSLPQKDVKFLKTDFMVEGSHEYSCGNPIFRYFPLTRYKDIELILVPMDCGDFEYRYYLLTVSKNKIAGEAYVEGVWFDPGKDDQLEEVSSYEISKNGKVTVKTDHTSDGEIEKTTYSYYQIMNDGKIKQLPK